MPFSPILLHEQMRTAGAEAFKQCTRCGKTWVDCPDFLADPAVILLAYQVSFEELEAGIFLFEHSCKASLSIVAGDFSHLYDGPVFEERAFGTDDCPGYCLKSGSFDRCPVRCECAYIREVMQIIKIWPKNEYDSSDSASMNLPGAASD